MAKAKMMIKDRKLIYGAVCLDWNQNRVYTNFSTDLEELIHKAETSSYGVIAIEKAHAGEPPVWTRDE